MKKLTRFITGLVVALTSVTVSQAQTSLFTYQGKLNDAAAAATGTYQMRFALFPGASTGSQIGPTLTFDGASLPAVQVTNGIFTVQLDFGSSPFNSGADRFLEISVKHTADPGYTTLAPRQQLTSSPYSIRSLSAGTADTATNATTAITFSGNLSGDVSGTQSATVVNAVGGKTSSAVATSVTDTTNATLLNTGNTIVKRDSNGNFVAGTIKASLSGNATTASTATDSQQLGGVPASGYLQAVAHDNTLTGSGTNASQLGINTGQVVTSLNNLTGGVTLAAGSNITLTPSGNTVTIASSSGVVWKDANGTVSPIISGDDVTRILFMDSQGIVWSYDSTTSQIGPACNVAFYYTGSGCSGSAYVPAIPRNYSFANYAGGVPRMIFGTPGASTVTVVSKLTNGCTDITSTQITGISDGSVSTATKPTVFPYPLPIRVEFAP